MKIIYIGFITIINAMVQPFISIQPGGITGFYTLGICSYIKEKYDTSKYNIMGSSSGAWNGLFMVCKDTKFIDKMMVQDFTQYQGLYEIQKELKLYLLSTYTRDDFELDRLYILTSWYRGLFLTPKIYNNFKTLEDAIDCCIASSHIPLITSNKIWKKYDNKLIFDGALFKIPKKYKNDIIISYDMFDSKLFKSFWSNMIKYNVKNITFLYKEGYSDAIQ